MGNFRLSFEPMAEPPQWLMKEAEAKNFVLKVHVLQNGESFTPLEAECPAACRGDECNRI